MTRKIKKFKIFGKVQGVAFRYFTNIEAKKLNIMGYAKNKKDDTVEVLAIGLINDINKLEQWLNKGSPFANVTRVLEIKEQINEDKILEYQNKFEIK